MTRSPRTRRTQNRVLYTTERPDPTTEDVVFALAIRSTGSEMGTGGVGHHEGRVRGEG